MNWLRNKWKELVATILITVVGGIFVTFLIKSWNVHLFWGVVVFVFFCLGWFIARTWPGRCNFYDDQHRRCKFGIVNFHENAGDTDEKALGNAKEHYTWTGATGRQPVSFMNARAQDLFKCPHSTCQYSFAIMDPNLKTLVLSHDGWENNKDGFSEALATNSTPAAPTHLAGSCKILENFAQDNPNRVQIHLHPMAPTFRVTVVDDEKAYVSFYRRNNIGFRGFQLEIKKYSEEDKCIFEWFRQFHERHIWEAERNGVIQAILRLSVKKLGKVSLSEIKEAVNTFRQSQRKPVLEDKVIQEVCNEWGLSFS